MLIEYIEKNVPLLEKLTVWGILSTFQLLLLEGTAWGLIMCLWGQRSTAQATSGSAAVCEGPSQAKGHLYFCSTLYKRACFRAASLWWTVMNRISGADFIRYETNTNPHYSDPVGSVWIQLNNSVISYKSSWFYGKQLRSAEDQSVFVIYDHCWSSPVSCCKPLPAGVTWCKHTDDLHE